MPHLQVLPIPALKDNYIWAIVDSKTNTALIVDPGEAQPVETFLAQNKLILKGILLTHHHWDHTNGAPELRDRYKVPVIGPAADRISSLTIPVHEPMQVHVPDFPLTLNVIDIPGHTLGHVAYYADGMLFCGDTLFSSGCGRLFEGTAEQMYHSLRKLAALPGNTNIYCGHEYTLNNLRFAQTVDPENSQIISRIKEVTEMRHNNLPSLPSTMKDELKTNPFLRCEVPEVIDSVETQSQKTLRNSVEVFAELRRLKDHF